MPCQTEKPEWGQTPGGLTPFRFVLVILFCASVGCADNIEPDAAMADAAITWLMLVDEGEYGESWERASSIFRPAIAKEDWLTTVERIRAPLGGVRGRVLRSAHAKRNPAGSPDGEYVLLTYDASFEDRELAVETLTMFREEDGSWRTAGYFIK